MDKYRAIKTIEDVRTRAVECSSQLINRNICDLGDFDTTTSQGYNWILGIDPNDVSTFDITVQKVPMGVCKKIATTGWAVPRIFIGNIGPITSANCAEENDMTFVFSKDLSELSASEGGDCPPGVETVCPEGFGKGCSGPRASGYCGCHKCYPCEGYTGSGYLTTCDTGRSCKSGGCVCTAGGCPAGQSNFCPEGSSWVAGGVDNCGDQCYVCQSSTPGECVATVCRQDSDCTDPAKPVCRILSNPANNECTVACKTPTTTKENCPCNSDKGCLDEGGNPLTEKAKYCNFSSKRCCECRSDSECPSGLCNGCDCVAQLICSPSLSEEACSRCKTPGNEFEWIGTACCPTATNTLNPYSNLLDGNCETCGGMINDAGECVTFECPSDISAITDQTSCQRCNGVWNCTNVNDERVCSCSKAQCATNADCGPDQYCGGSTGSCYYPNYNRCVNASYSRLTIQHNGQTESWYIFNNAMSWWDALNACKSIGKSLQPKEVVLERWKKLGVLGYQCTVWTSSSLDSCTSVGVDLSSGFVGYIGYRPHGGLLAFCR